NDLRVTIFDDTRVYVARISPDTPFRYRLLTASKDDAGYSCSVPLRKNVAALRRISLVAAAAMAVDSAPPRQLQIVMAVGPTMCDSFQYAGDDVTLENDVADLLNDANELLGRDVAVTLVLSGTVLRATETDLAGADPLASIQAFIQNAATTNGWP